MVDTSDLHWATGFCCVTSKRYYLYQKAYGVLYKMRYVLWLAALLEVCDISQDGCHVGHHLGFYPKLEIIKKMTEIEIFYASHVEYDRIKDFAAFCQHFTGEKHIILYSNLA